MKKLFLLFLLFCCKPPNANCQLPYWQQQVNFNIDVTLNDKDHTLDGFVKMEYYNNSPDTLYFIWFHLWPNAYKNDRTAFSDQLLENGRTDFYFTTSDKLGYINRLNFKVNGTVAKIEDHPLHQDIIKIVLPLPLAPNSSAKIQTPFHEQLPFNFSRGGHAGQSYQVTQWFPKPAVYDRKGWHPMPYLDQGEFYSEFGNFEVQITLPQNYVVAATGILQDEAEQNWLNKRTRQPGSCAGCEKSKKQEIDRTAIISSKDTKTIHFKQDNIHDFAWFADKSFIVYHDTMQLTGGRKIDLYTYHLPKKTTQDYWAKSISFIKNTIVARSKWLGEYPYDIVSAVEAEMGFSGGMEYPTITSITPVDNEHDLEGTIEHEVGHNWNYGILATNEREHPWMDEGINTFYDDRYNSLESYTNKEQISKAEFFSKRIPKDLISVAFKTMAAGKKDQPIETSSENFSDANYQLVPYYKTSQWMKLLEQQLGTTVFDSCMHEYYRRWKFRHPYPEDLKKIMEEISGKKMDTSFALLTKKGNLPAPRVKKDIKFGSFFNIRDTDKHHYIFAAPLAGFNFYDKIMLGAMLHNYTLPAEKFQFLLAPLYATGSKQLNGLGRMTFSWFPGYKGMKAELSLAGATFSGDSFTDSANNTTYQRFSKLVPSLKIIFANKHPRSHLLTYLQWKTFFIREQGLLFTRDTNNTDIVTFPSESRYVNRLRFVVDNNRVLYPYRALLQVDQGKDFARLAFTGNYYFNYANGGGMNVRVFAGKFFYLVDKTYTKQFETDRYHLNMTGANGSEDYTYSDYFIGRNEFEKYPSQQIIQRDGFFKVRTDLLSSKIGKTDNWLSAANFTTDIPQKINPLQVLPIRIPLKVFVDIGTYAEAWQQNDAPTGKFLYDAGLQLSLLGNSVNIYIPLLYSKVYRDYFKSTIVEKRFWKNISFTIDIQNINLRKLAPQIPL